ncbi:MAG: putative pterin-4-alpha-carbinolamine dehydratase [Bradyrhizobium sp.]|nr:putative pterin-4-alpha-carbinolamine dehydratase [Bradyrhizobium sp.]
MTGAIPGGRPPLPRRLSDKERVHLLTHNPEWSLVKDRDAITRYFRFRDFVEAFAFISAVALLAERAGHHPEWTNVYDRVEISLTTHDAGGLTERDAAMAGRIDAVARLFEYETI